MGRPRKSIQQHELGGTVPHYSEADDQDTEIPAGRPQIPRAVRKAGLAGFYKKIVRLLERRRHVSEGDALLLEQLAFVYDRWSRQSELLRTEGEVCTYTRLDKNGEPVESVRANIRLAIVERADRQLVDILGKLGLTPIHRAKIRKTGINPELEIIPGSCADVMPELLLPRNEGEEEKC